TAKTKSSAISKKATAKKTAKTKSSAISKKATAKKSTSKKSAEKTPTTKKTTQPSQTTTKIKTKRKRKTSSEIAGPSAEESKQWQKLAKQYEGKKIPSYDMKKTYNDTPVIKHNNFGLGFILATYNNRLKVLFKEGTKTLISNYQD
ncbi:MAG: hypothetical protein OXN83_05375, partial [Oligoflexia bacterium]|nr:hypothetical protein [Oligoflexia bacterium]